MYIDIYGDICRYKCRYLWEPSSGSIFAVGYASNFTNSTFFSWVASFDFIPTIYNLLLLQIVDDWHEA